MAEFEEHEQLLAAAKRAYAEGYRQHGRLLAFSGRRAGGSAGT